MVVQEARSTMGVDAIITDVSDTTVSVPMCDHGPTVLFERFFKDKQPRKFFACSACRDRKECSFFQWQDEKITAGKTIIQKEIAKKLTKACKKEKKLFAEADTWCFDCAAPVVSGAPAPEAHADDHKARQLLEQERQSPTQVVHPLHNKKSNAQFFFANTASSLLLRTVKKLQTSKVICLGTPTVFEMLRASRAASGSGADPFLLDIDGRFSHFFSGAQFARYNMFNGFFFDAERGERSLKEFLTPSDDKSMAEEDDASEEESGDDIMILIDPPFGGLVNLLASTVQKLKELIGEVNSEAKVKTVLVFPYFLEAQVKENFPDFKMSDYKVQYSDHPNYKKTDKKGSPVRLFTDIEPRQLTLPIDEGYRFCKPCQRFSAKENAHCKECSACTSKDGRTSVHCFACAKCVKPGRTHCEECKSCELPEHRCGMKDATGCHVCGDLNHKRRDCPNKGTALATGMKRKANEANEAKTKDGKSPKMAFPVVKKTGKPGANAEKNAKKRAKKKKGKKLRVL